VTTEVARRVHRVAGGARGGRLNGLIVIQGLLATTQTRGSATTTTAVTLTETGGCGATQRIDGAGLSTAILCKLSGSIALIVLNEIGRTLTCASVNLHWLRTPAFPGLSFESETGHVDHVTGQYCFGVEDPVMSIF